MQSTKKSLFWPKLLRRRQNCEQKQAKKALFGNFLPKKSLFFRRALPLKLSVDWSRKNLGSISQNWISQNSSKGGPFGSAGGRIPKSAPKSAPATARIRAKPRTFFWISSRGIRSIFTFLIKFPITRIFKYLMIYLLSGDELIGRIR